MICLLKLAINSQKMSGILKNILIFFLGLWRIHNSKGSCSTSEKMSLRGIFFKASHQLLIARQNIQDRLNHPIKREALQVPLIPLHLH